MKLTVSLDKGKWDNALRELAEVMGQTVEEACRGQARLVLRDCIRFTPPFTKKPYAPITESFKKQFEAGKEAIKGDILRVFRPANWLWTMTIDKKGQKSDRAKAVAKFARKGDIAGIKKLFPAGDKIRRLKAVEKVANPLYYEQTRRTKTGRPPRKFPGVLIHRGTVPTWENRNNLKGMTTYGKLHQIFKEKVKGIGTAKAGWLYAADKLGLPSRDVPSWVRRHQGKVGTAGVFDVVEGLKATVTCGNTLSWIQESGKTLRVVNMALKNRMRNLPKQIEMAAKKKARKIGVKT